MKKIAVIGATGLVGRNILASLEEEKIQFDELFLFSSSKSAGQKVSFRGQDHVVSELTPHSFQDLQVDVGLMSAGSSTSLRFAGDILKGCRYLIDNSSAFRRNPDVPLVVPEINFHTIAETGSKIIANPNCSTIQLVIPLYLMNRIAPLKRVIVTTLQSVSGSGIKAIDELKALSECALRGRELNAEVYADPISFNIIPRIGAIDEDGYCEEEVKVMFETNKILSLDLDVSATTLRVPVFYCHSESVHVEFVQQVAREKIVEAFSGSPWIEYFDQDYPMPLHYQGKNEVCVGRLRNDLKNPGFGYAFWIVADNLRRGAATNAVRIAGKLLAEMS